jgi:hypothetical protein
MFSSTCFWNGSLSGGRVVGRNIGCKKEWKGGLFPKSLITVSARGAHSVACGFRGRIDPAVPDGRCLYSGSTSDFPRVPVNRQRTNGLEGTERRQRV